MLQQQLYQQQLDQMKMMQQNKGNKRFSFLT